MIHRAPLNRQQQRTVAACLEMAMTCLAMPKAMQDDMVAIMSHQIAEASNGSGGFDNYFSLRRLVQNAETPKEGGSS